MRGLHCAAVVAVTALVSACASIVNNAASGFAENLSNAILNQPDPAIVRDGTPAYLLLLDSFAAGSPDDADILGAAARLYAAYGTAFVQDPERSRQLTSRARAYGSDALCAADAETCGIGAMNFQQFENVISDVRKADEGALYSYCVGALAYIRAHSGDWAALADLPKVELALKHLLALKPEENLGNIYLYLGILNSLRPPALGGDPEIGRKYFERALELTGGRDLSVKVEYARGYARLVYDRELHDRLLNEVLAADVEQPGMTLFNSIAQRDAAELLASADEYF